MTLRRPKLAILLAGLAVGLGWLALSEAQTARSVRAQARDGVEGRLAGIPAAEARLREAARKAKVPWPLADVTVRVEKAARRLTLISKGKALRTYRVALGFTPEGHKEREGDGKTPEGDYWVCTRNDRSRFHLFLGLSYPGPKDAKAGLAAGRIDAETAAKIEAVKAPDCPPWKTKLGGEVGLHGHGASRDWTAGCVAVEDAEVDELWVACPLGTKVTIVP